MEHEYDVGSVPVKIYDTRGFNDSSVKSKKILDKARSTMKTADVVLICHRLYGRIDCAIEEMLNDIVHALGSDLIKQSIIVFTYGDEYLLHCDDGASKEAIVTKMEEQQKDEQFHIRSYLVNKKGIKPEIVKAIPCCITSGKKTVLPTSDNWVDDLWQLIERRCKPEATEFVKWYRRHAIKLIAGSSTAVLSGATVGGVLGSGVIPGVGTAIGGAVGGVVGGVVGGAVGGTGAWAVEKIITQQKKKLEFDNDI